MNRLPRWAQKPRHKKEVIATELGWVVESTGEILVKHRHLDTKLKELLASIEDLQQVVIVTPEDNGQEDAKDETQESDEGTEKQESESTGESEESSDETGEQQTTDDEKSDTSSEVTDQKKVEEQKPKRRGRPKGSKNKTK